MRHFLLIWFALSSVAQASPLTSEQIASRLKTYQQIQSFRTRFTQLKHLKEVGIDLKSSGELIVHRPDEVIWKVVEPAPLTLTINATEVRLAQGTGKDTRVQQWKLGGQISEQSVRGIRELTAWLKLDVPAIAAIYSVEENSPNELTCQRKVDDPNTPFKSMRLRIAPSGYLEKLFLEERSGDLMELTFSKPVVVNKETP